jgi:hypothetical protein
MRSKYLLEFAKVKSKNENLWHFIFESPEVARLCEHLAEKCWQAAQFCSSQARSRRLFSPGDQIIYIE